jgi:phospholipid/cholesterol/gamma-HCH transport system ATP-binding protein
MDPRPDYAPPPDGGDGAPAGPRAAHAAFPQAQPPGSGPPPDDVAIELRDVHKAFGDKVILEGASLAIPKGTSAVVMGGSGTGKSVTIKHVVQLLQPDKGEVWVLGQQVETLAQDAMDALRLRIGYLFQSGALFDSMTVFENMDFVLERHTDLNAGERKDRIMETLEWVNLPDNARQFPSELSGGQRKRAGLARSIILQPEIMLYDEPTTGLDPISVRVVSDLINRLRDERGITSITITHDLLCAEIISDQVFFLADRHFAVQGTLAEVAAADRPFIREFFADYEAAERTG